MEKEQELFEAITKKLLRQKGVRQGKMMSAPGITRNGKVFCVLLEEGNDPPAGGRTLTLEPLA